jgi:hypothetical protein
MHELNSRTHGSIFAETFAGPPRRQRLRPHGSASRRWQRRLQRTIMGADESRAIRAKTRSARGMVAPMILCRFMTGGAGLIEATLNKTTVLGQTLAGAPTPQATWGDHKLETQLLQVPQSRSGHRPPAVTQRTRLSTPGAPLAGRPAYLGAGGAGERARPLRRQDRGLRHPLQPRGGPRGWGTVFLASASYPPLIPSSSPPCDGTTEKDISEDGGKLF